MAYTISMDFHHGNAIEIISEVQQKIPQTDVFNNSQLKLCKYSVVSIIRRTKLAAIVSDLKNKALYSIKQNR